MTMAIEKVKALRDFRGAEIGMKTKGERFDYDVAPEPDELVKLGLVERPQAKAAGK